MSRVFAAVTDRIVAPAPAVWPGATGSIFVRILPNGWASGTGTDRVFWSYGYAGATLALLVFQRYVDNRIYVGWYGDGAHGGDQRIAISDAGCFFDASTAGHLFTWDASASRYYIDGTERGARVATLTTQTLSGEATSNVTIGNYNAAFSSIDTGS